MPFSIIFPGQGSQSVGMLSDLASENPQIIETFQEASDVLGYDLWHLSQNGPAEDLNQTHITQPALLTAGVATWRVLQSKLDELPSAVAGHSLGEYTALVASGAIAFTDAVSLVEKRGQFMQQAVPSGQGAMAAVLGMDDDAIVVACSDLAEAGETLQAVNFNSPGQVVVAGSVAAVERFVAQGKSLGAKLVKQLPVSVPSHCDLMRPAAEQLAKELKGIELLPPSIPVVHNVDAQTHDDPADIRDLLTKQLYQPVQWVKCINTLTNNFGVTQHFEAGPGKVLTGLGKRINRTIPTVAVFDNASLHAATS